MILTDEQLKELQELAELPGITPQEIAVILQVNVDAFVLELLKTDCHIHKAYNTGKLKSKATFSKKVMQLSNQGSGPAQTLVAKLMKDAEIKNMRDLYG